MVEIIDFSFSYSKEKPILCDINLKIERGFFGLIGASGCGKSTLCLALNGLIPREINGFKSGKVIAGGMDTDKYQVKEMARKVGMVFQNPESQLFSLCAEDEIAFGPGNFGMPWNEIKNRVSGILKLLNIEHLRNKSPEQMSSGEQQKIAIASALALEPDVLVLDEPTANLDPKSAEEIFIILKKISKEKLVFLAEHNVNQVFRYCDEVAVMDKGVIVMQGRANDVLTRKDFFKYVDLSSLAELGKKIGLSKPPLIAEDLSAKIKINKKSIFSEAKIEAGKPIIEVKDLFFDYEKENPILEDINLKIAAGEFVAIVGNNGGGKSTLALNLIGLLKPKKGEISIGDFNIRKETVSKLAQAIGYAFQNPDLQIFEDTLTQEIAFGLKNLKLAEEIIDKNVARVIKAVGLGDYAESDPFSLSLGQKRRLTIASILAMESKIIILDEPSTGIDNKTIKSLMDLIVRINKDGHTIIMITHDMDLVAQYAKRVVVLSEGKIIFDGPTRKTFAQSDILEKANLMRPEINRLGHMLGNSEVLTTEDVMQLL